MEEKATPDAEHARPDGAARPPRRSRTRLRDRDAWKLFALFPKAHLPLTVAWWALIAARGTLPAILVVAVGSLVGRLNHDASLVTPLVVIAVAFVAMQVLVPLQAQTSTALGERVSALLHDILLDATTRPGGLAHLEDRALVDRLTDARDFDQGVAGPPLNISVGIVAGGLVQTAVGIGQVAVLGGYTWWAPPLIGAAWLSTHWLLRESSFWDRNTGEVLDAQRRSDHTYKLAVDAPAAKELRLFGLGDWVVEQFTANRRRLVELRWQETRLRQKPLRWAVAILLLANGLLLFRLATDASSGALGIGAVAVFAQAAVGASALAFGGPSWALPPTAQSVAAVLDLVAPMARAGQITAGAQRADGLPRTHIRFRDVHFTYPTGTRPVFQGLDLTIEAGTSLAVVGVNGAGKTTLAKLLCRMYEPTRGAIEVDGTDLRDLGLASWRDRVTAVFQDFIRYELPLRDNVAPLGAPDTTVRAALADAGAESLADLDTILSPGYDGGTDLSGGQWQRVAVARALCAVRQGAGVVVLDEPTAQLDVRGEAEIFERILRATEGHTTVLISHRFSTVRHAHRICVLEQGRVVELGTHDELMAAGGRYHEMFQLQASRFEAEDTDDVAV
ncbi:ABC transporter ATP-binding protein [Streptomyces sp. NPDC057052]|uniref:ABC transporter ATP-binding protein n=1 Tax=Streptomyces sp. NPDC057052 TaxID=3346010 RepID=UPI003632F427